MKKLNFIFDLLLFPFLFALRSSPIQSIIGHFERRNVTQKKLLFVFASFFVFLNFTSYAETEANNDCATADVILASGDISADDIGSSSTPNNGSPDLDFYSFDTASDGELNVTITNTNGKDLTYSSLSDLCPSSTIGTLNSTSVSLIIPSTSIGTYYVYVVGIENPASSYTISATFTENIPSVGTDLKITKTGSVDTVLIYDPFYYTINVANVGDTNTSNVTVIDALPSGMSMISEDTHTDSPDWNCTQPLGSNIVTCDLDGNLTTGSISSIKLHVKAPSRDGVVTNEANVTSSANGIGIDTDVDPSNNTATATTTITAEVDTSEHICYTEKTETIIGQDYNTSCEIKGNFYYGNGCDAYVTVTEVNTTDELSYVKVYKMYAPDLSSGSYECNVTATPADPSYECTNITNLVDFGSYQEGYAVDINESNISNIAIDIKDSDSDKTPRIDGVAMFGDYWTAEGFHHTGRIFECSGLSEGGIEITSSADVIDTPITDSTTAGYYNSSVVPNPTNPIQPNIKYIQTMVATTATRNIEGVFLNLAGESTTYIYTGSQSPALPYSITPYLTDADCNAVFENIIQAGTTQQLVIDVPSGGYSATGQMIVSDIVRQDARIQMIFIDPNALSIEGQQCLANSSTTGNFARLAQCVNSEVQYKTAFGQDAWDRCGEGNGNPCISANHGYSCGENDTTCDEYNALYDNELGCYMCTFNIQPSCSTDNFAIRPDRFDAAIVETYIPTHYPNLLRAGQDYNTSLIARNADDAVSTSYTVLDFDQIVDVAPATKYFNGPTWVEDTGGLLLGNSYANAQDPTHMVNGLSSSSTGGSLVAEALIGVTFDDVGRVKIDIADINWSQVDNDDTPMDCNSSEHTYICGELNATFIPHHFSFAELNISNQAGPDTNFTYVANKRGMPETNLPIRSPMAARVITRIESRNKQDEITQNFREDGPTAVEKYYENNISVTQSVLMTYPRALPNDPDAYLYPDANESEIDDKRIGFGRLTGPETDDKGTRNIKWDEDTYPLEFNFKRDLSTGANPFDVNGSFFSIALTSNYTDPDDGDTAIIKGARVGDKNASACAGITDGSCVNDNNAKEKATFYYARTRSSKFFYGGNTASPVLTPIFIDIYCDLGFPACDEYGIDVVSGQINDKDWWLSWNHSRSQGDGNITLTASANGGVSVPPKPNIDASGGADKTVEVNTTVIPNIVDIDFVTDDSLTDYTNAWLIYNKDTDSVVQAVPSPFYRVEFIGSAGWAGHGDTGHVVGGQSNIEKNRRLEW